MSRALALSMLAALFVVMFARAESALLPFPWLSGARRAHESTQGMAALLRIERAAETFCLLEGELPPSLEILVDRGLLASRDLALPNGEPLGYVSSSRTYVLGQADAGPTAVSYSLAGNFLLDPDFNIEPSDAAPPLVLLD